MWLSKEIHYTDQKVWKGRRTFGILKRVKNGYRLLEPLEYLWNGEILILPEGYVWDGPSYPKFLERSVGRRDKDALLAASAMHDSLTVRILSKTASGPTYRKFSIPDAAVLYKKMIREWPDTEVSNRKSFLQWLGLRIFQPLAISNDGLPWVAYPNNSKE